ncbi:Hypothetical protein R9X50_00606400 [Acrodontium crateriforme]|uniref:Uncharacterized protein n=1 Tax=Acrodontium crateriforme TaxID=150365 RepID=A0AAQ3MAG1_9PEZI|nr:Hypothetical protein R9X50_00606400 [Acrodontium crateriforme]
MLFTFGPNDTYFFDDGNGNRKWRAGPDISQYLSNTPIGKITTVALGEGGAFFLNFLTPDGRSHMNYFTDPEDRYDALHAWLFTENVAHSRDSVAVSLGTNGSFFAASNQGHRWQKIPEGLSDYYQKFTRLDLFTKSRVNTADIGHNGSFLGIGVDNVWFWNLSDDYPELSKMIGQKGVNNCTFITINPFAPNQHFVAFNDRTAHWSLPPPFMQDIQSLFQQYAAQAGAHIPPSRPSFKPTSSGSWRPPWKTSSSSVQFPPVTNSPVASPTSSGGSKFDFNQAMGLTQSALDAYNNAQGQQIQGQGDSSGFQFVNDLTNTGLMIGQFAGQAGALGGAAAACSIM